MSIKMNEESRKSFVKASGWDPMSDNYNMADVLGMIMDHHYNSDQTNSDYVPPLRQQCTLRDIYGKNNVPKRKDAESLGVDDIHRLIKLSRGIEAIENDNDIDKAKNTIKKVEDGITKLQKENEELRKKLEAYEKNQKKEDKPSTEKKEVKKEKEEKKSEEKAVAPKSIVPYKDEKEVVEDVLVAAEHPQDDVPDPENVQPEKVVIDGKFEEVGKENSQVMDFKPEDYIKNNQQYCSNITGLEKIHKLVSKNGMWVMYNPNENMPNILDANFIDRKSGKLISTLRVDPYIIYGDDVRVVTNSGDDTKFLQEMFIPVYQENLILKAIKGQITDKDKKEFMMRAPKALNDFSQKYSFFDRIDMRGITKNGKKISKNDWYKLVCNISKVLADKNVPICRMRVTNFFNPDQFMLVCDNKVMISHDDHGLAAEPSNEQAFKEFFAVEFDAKAYGDKLYELGHADAIPEAEAAV